MAVPDVGRQPQSISFDEKRHRGIKHLFYFCALLICLHVFANEANGPHDFLRLRAVLRNGRRAAPAARARN